MAKRLFIGFPVPITELDSLNAALKKLRIGADKHEMEFDWVPRENFHVTLNFLGATPPQQLADVSHVVTKIVDAHAPFPTSLRGLGGFPDEHHARVLWAGVRKSKQLSNLQADLTEALTSLGYKPDERDYTPHLTIARTRKARTSKDLISPYVRTTFGDLKIDRLVLYESVMQGPKPHYDVLETFPLNSSAKPTESSR